MTGTGCDWPGLPPGYELTTTVEPAEEPVSVEAARLNARAEEADDGPLWPVWVAAARRLTERETGRRWVTQTCRLTLPAWPADGLIRLPVTPVQSVTSVKYYDAAGVQRTLGANTDYRAWLGRERPLIYPPAPAYWPDLYDGRLDRVEVVFVAGYGAASAVPAEAKAAVLLCCALWNEDRGDAADQRAALGMPAGARRLLQSLDARGYL